jgi:hypothetical protein
MTVRLNIELLLLATLIFNFLEDRSGHCDATSLKCQNSVFICYYRPNVSSLCHIFIGSISYIHAMIFTWILVATHQHVISFLCVYSRIYIPQEQGGPVTPSDTGFPLRRLV